MYCAQTIKVHKKYTQTGYMCICCQIICMSVWDTVKTHTATSRSIHIIQQHLRHKMCVFRVLLAVLAVSTWCMLLSTAQHLSAAHMTHRDNAHHPTSARANMLSQPYPRRSSNWTVSLKMLPRHIESRDNNISLHDFRICESFSK